MASLPAPAGGEQPQDVDVELPGPAPAGEPSPEGTRLAAPAQEAPLPAGAQMPIAAPAAVAAAPAPAPEAAVEAPTPPVAIQAVPAEAPAAPAPPAAPTPPAPKASPAPTPAKAPLPASASLPRRSYFVQLGAYTTEGLAEKLANQLRNTYDVVVLAVDSSGRLFYKVLVGPLNRDESGTLLYQFRARGFKDAFVQYVE